MLRRDDGNALLEFVWLAILLLVPLVFIVGVAAQLQRAAFATTAAARDAGRAYATADSDEDGQARALLAAQLAVDDQHVAWPDRPASIVECGACDFSPGSTFRVVVETRVHLPLVPAFLCRDGRCPADIPVRATHTERIDEFRTTCGRQC